MSISVYMLCGWEGVRHWITADLDDRSEESTWNVAPRERSWKTREGKRRGRQILSAVLGDTGENGEEAIILIDNS